MTKKDFETVACIVAEIATHDMIRNYNAIKLSKDNIDRALKATNPRYDKEKFWDYVYNIVRDYEEKIRQMDY